MGSVWSLFFRGSGDEEDTLARGMLPAAPSLWAGLGWGGGVGVLHDSSTAFEGRILPLNFAKPNSHGIGGRMGGQEGGCIRWVSSYSSSSSASLGLTDFSQVDTWNGQIHQFVKEPGLTKLVIPNGLRQSWKRGRDLTAPWRSRRIWEDGGFRDAGP